MGYTVVGLKDKILALHPEIAQHGIVPTLTFDDEKSAYVLTLTKGAHRLSTYIEKADADACMDGPGRKCLNVAVLVTQILEEFKEGE
jgi:hypothetical protein